MRQDEVMSAVAYIQSALRAAANPEKAPGMQAYMKTDMPFYGVQKPGRVPLLRHLVEHFPPSDREGYERLVVAVWSLPHREEKYIAQGLALAHKRFIVPASLPLYRRMITEGAWWDLVDDVATHMVRQLVLSHPEEVWPAVDTWIGEEDMWLRRSAIICQVGSRDRTDAARLFGFCDRCIDEKEFFIRKAIGWALREYAKSDPEAVAGFARTRRHHLSGLSYREATKHIGHLMPK